MKGAQQHMYLLVLMVSTIMCLGLSFSTNAQSADVTEGCVPLTVQFSGPDDLSEYFWDFKDGNTQSSLQNPQRIFTAPGTYNVSLHEGTSGGQIGEVIITVYPDIEIAYSAKILDECFPREYRFLINPEVPDGVEIYDINWQFGDGESDGGATVIHTYDLADLGQQFVGLEILTTPADCGTSAIIDTIDVEQEINAEFVEEPSGSCEVPIDINFDLVEEIYEGATYTWDFGDGTVIEDAASQVHTYTEGGTYTAMLIVAKEECSDTFSVLLPIGDPKAQIEIPDTLCIGIDYTFINNTPGDAYIWTFDTTATFALGNNQFLQSPRLSFDTEGWKSVRMLSTLSSFQNCIVDTTIQVYVQDPKPYFTIDPSTSCQSPQIYTFECNEEYVSYVWNGDYGEQTHTETYIEPERDSFYVNVLEILPITLRATTKQGCVGQFDTTYQWQYPNAGFYPEPRQGCAPLGVSFLDYSTSGIPIVNYTFDYGNGETQSFNETGSHFYIFEEPGDYYVNLIVENEDGCIDTSLTVLIEVGDPASMNVEVDIETVCRDEEVTFTPTDFEGDIDDFYIFTDDGRAHYCDSLTSYTFSTPGEMDIDIVAISNGCEKQIKIEGAVKVEGPLAQPWYMINCDDPLTVMFADSSIDASRVEWTVEPGVVYTEENFNHTFAQSGDYMVYLHAFNDETGCPSHMDSILVHVRNPKAAFDIPDYLCVGDSIDIHASASIDVDTTCFKGFTWYWPKHGRPRKKHQDSVGKRFYVPGIEEVTLVVEDINGCTDTLSKNIQIMSIDPDFAFDDPICFPVDLHLQDATQSDTSIVNWQWLHEVYDSSYIFGTDASVTPYFDFLQDSLAVLPIQLVVEDAVGCVDTVEIEINVYRPTIEIDAKEGVCVGDTIGFRSTVSAGDDLTYLWEFGNGDTSIVTSPIAIYDSIGNYTATVTLTEESTGCMSQQMIDIIVTDLPIASFDMTTAGNTVDSNGIVCYPGIIQFNNTSMDNGNPVSYSWNYYQDSSFHSNSVKESPSLIFGGGAYDAVLTVTSEYGCADSVLSSFNVIETFGDLVPELETICRGDSLYLSLVDTANVASWSVDLGDGTVLHNQDPIYYPVGATSTSGTVNVVLTLQNDGYACEKVQIIPITIEGSTDSVIQKIYAPRNEVVTIDSLEGFDDIKWIQGHPSLICPECDPPQIQIDTAMCVDLEAHRLVGCDLTVYHISVVPREPIEIPNLFTPNGDGTNDFFNYVEIFNPDKGSSVKEVVRFEIYDRWGEMVYNNETPDTGWDGWYDDQAAPAEVYGYLIQVRFKDDKLSPIYKGDVTLIR